jgi:heptaprenyl diphosphate synthase
MFALITRGITAFLMSLCGGMLSLAMMWILFRFTKKSIGYIGIGVLSAVSHNMGQLIVAVVILGKAILYIAPILMLSGIVCGALTGTIFRYVYPLLHRHTNKLSNHFTND